MGVVPIDAGPNDSARFNLLRDWILSPAPLTSLATPAWKSGVFFSHARVFLGPFACTKDFFYDGAGFGPAVSGCLRRCKLLFLLTL